MGLIIHNNKCYCSKYHRKRLEGKDYEYLDDNVQDYLCGAISEPLMRYNESTHQWFPIDETKTIYVLLFELKNKP